MTETQLPPLSAAYTDLRGRVTELVRAATPEQLDAIAPATPEWRVRDVLAHLVGVTADVLAGRLDGVATDEWTQAQVDARATTPIETMLAEWAENAVTVEPMIPDFGVSGGQAVLDACTHEHDLRDALRQPGARDSTAVHIGSAWLGDRIGEFNGSTGHGAIRIETDLWSLTYGESEPTSTLRVSAFELMRGSTGRRSQAQLDAWEWIGPARGELVVMPIFTARATDFDG